MGCAPVQHQLVNRTSVPQTVQCTYQSSLQTGQLLVQLLDLKNITLLASETLIVLGHVFVARHEFL